MKNVMFKNLFNNQEVTMKRLVVLAVMYSLVLVVFTLSIYAENISTSKKEKIVNSLLEGLSSENSGLRSAAARAIAGFIEEQVLHKNDIKQALFPLMKMLRESESDEEKIAAAFSLYSLEDMRGIYQLKGAAKFAESFNVRETAKGLYIRFHKENKITYTDDFNKTFEFFSAFAE